MPRKEKSSETSSKHEVVQVCNYPNTWHWMMHTNVGRTWSKNSKSLALDVYCTRYIWKEECSMLFYFSRDAFIKAGNRWVPPAQPSRVGRMLTKTLEVYDIPVCTCLVFLLGSKVGIGCLKNCQELSKIPNAWLNKVHGLPMNLSLSCTCMIDIPIEYGGRPKILVSYLHVRILRLR